jgi:hypothetical protein
MLAHGVLSPDGKRDLVKTCSLVVHEGDVTSWSSVFRLLVALMFSALVNPAPGTQLDVYR